MVTTILNVLYAGVLTASCAYTTPETLICFSSDGQDQYELTVYELAAAAIEVEAYEPGNQVEFFQQEVQIDAI